MYMNCECGKTIMKKSYWRHIKTQYHKSRINVELVQSR
jgi:hypothetical protein